MLKTVELKENQAGTVTEVSYGRELWDCISLLE